MYILNGKPVVKGRAVNKSCISSSLQFPDNGEGKTIVMDIVPIGRNPSYCQAVSFQFLSQGIFLYKFII